MTYIYKNIEAAIDKLDGAYAPNTLRAYYADARQFVDWCAKKNLTPFPITSEVMCAYIEGVQEDYAYGTLRRRVASLRRLNRMLGFETLTNTDQVYLAIRRLKRSKSIEQRQAVGINHDILLKMIKAQPDTPAGIRNRALLSVGYDFLARRSELLALRVGDVAFEPDGSLRGMIRRSKADPFGRGRLVYGSERSAKLLRKWLRLKPKEIDTIFCAVNNGNYLDRPICARHLNEIIKCGVIKVKGCARPSEREVSGHSLRVGAAQDLLVRGFDIAAIARAGGWSDFRTVSRYLRFSQHNIWK